jgi:hypothetical protein
VRFVRRELLRCRQPDGSGNLAGLAGADQICQTAAQALGGRDATRTWRAYLSQEQKGAMPRVNARDRIGDGLWHNVKHQLIASNLADLHGDQQRETIPRMSHFSRQIHFHCR